MIQLHWYVRSCVHDILFSHDIAKYSYSLYVGGTGSLDDRKAKEMQANAKGFMGTENSVADLKCPPLNPLQRTKLEREVPNCSILLEAGPEKGKAHDTVYSFQQTGIM